MKSVLFVVLATVLCLSAVTAQSYTDNDEDAELSLAEVSSEAQTNEAAVAAAESSTETEQEMAADIAAHLQADAQAAQANEAAAAAAHGMETEQQAEQQIEQQTEQAMDMGAAMDMGMTSEADMEGPAPLARLTRRNRGAAAPKTKSRPLVAPKPQERIKFHSERVEAQGTNRFEDPEMGKLNLALDAVKEDILSTNKQINDERKWVIAVAKIIASYNDKMKRVETHIVQLRKEMKALYRKKKQIENLKLQKALEAKLKEARDELSVLTNSLKHVAVKQGELNKSGADLRQTIAGIQGQLAKLRGQQLRKPRPAAKGKGKRARRGGKGRRGARKGRRGAKRCKKGFRFSKKARKCVRGKARRV